MSYNQTKILNYEKNCLIKTKNSFKSHFINYAEWTFNNFFLFITYFKFQVKNSLMLTLIFISCDYMAN